MSSFFRRPTDGSSSSGSDSEDSDEPDISQHGNDDAVGNEVAGHDIAPTGTTESFSSQDTNSVGNSQEDAGTSNPNVEQQRNLLLVSLLEDFFKTRASEMMNSTLPDHRFDRSSPEVQPLARKLYEDATQTLVGSGFLPAMATSETSSNRHAKAAYVRGMETFAIQYAQKNEIMTGRSQLQLPDVTDRMAVIRRNSRDRDPFMDLLQGSMSRMSMAHHAAQNPSPYSDMAVSIRAPRRSHYESSFTQLRLLGRGGFGRVYHAYNLFDNKEYAVKKIPLSPRLSQRYRESGHKELNNVLREVQALAQLDHSNVVRYHATWIEEPRELPDNLYPSRKPSLTIGGRKLIADFAASSQRPQERDALPKSVPAEVSDGIVFGADSVSDAPARHVDRNIEAWSANNVASVQETTDARTSSIFTDGHAHPSVQHDTVPDSSVYVLHVQMSVYPMTLAQYLAPLAPNARSGPSSPSSRRHCFHLLPALKLLMGILCGLQYVHARGMIHRDIKPSNIFLAMPAYGAADLCADGYYDVGACTSCTSTVPHLVNPRIGDFGLVAEIARSDGLETQGGTDHKAVGTEYYRPPLFTDSRGKRRSHSPDAKLDVFALGVILVELLWRCTTSTERLHVLQDLQRETTPIGLREKIDAEGHEHGTGDAVVQVVEGMTARDPRRRMGCTEAKEALEGLLARCRRPPASLDQDGEMMGGQLRKVSSIDARDVAGVEIPIRKPGDSAAQTAGGLYT